MLKTLAWWICQKGSIRVLNVVSFNLRNRNRQGDAFMEGFLSTFITSSPKFSGLQPHAIRNLKTFDRGDTEALATHYLLSRITILLFYDPYIRANRELLQQLRTAYDLNDD